MIGELDIWRAATLLIQQHGDEAEIVAAKRADLMLERGDLDGQQLWMWIRRAVAELQAPATGSLTMAASIRISGGTYGGGP